MATNSSRRKDPRRVAIGRENQKKWKGHTPEGLERIRKAALAHKPWLHSTGPRTPEGKAQVALNGKKRQLGPRSVREIRADIAELNGFLHEMQEAAGLVERFVEDVDS